MIVTQTPLQDMYVLQNKLISATTTLSVGDTVIIDPAATNSVIGAAGTTGIILGTVLTINNGPTGGNIPLQLQTITTSATNLTVELVSVDILVPQNIHTYIADLTAPAGTTPGSDQMGYFNIDGTNNGQLDETTYLVATEEQFLSYGVNPGNTSQVIGVWTKIAQA